MSIAFLLTTFIVVATPGTGALYTIQAGLSRGRQASVIAAIGCTLGIVPHMLAAITGLAALLNASAIAFDGIKWLGVAYLLYMSWNAARNQGALHGDVAPTAPSAARVIVSGVLINILNPKLTVFFFAFLPQFVDSTEANVMARMLELSAVFMALTLVIFVIYGICAGTLRDRILSRPRVMAWIGRVFAASFALLGVKLALTNR